MTTTFRAAVLVSEGSVGVCLTSEEQAHLPEDDLLAQARAFLDEIGVVEGEIVVTDFTR